MKLQQPPKGRGSFGIPAEMQEAVEKKKAEAAAKAHKEPEQEEAPPPPSVQKSEDTGFAKEEAPLDKVVSDLSPHALLKKYNINFGTEEFQQVLFRGYVEFKNVVVVKGIKGSVSDFTATVRTLTGKEYDEVDEILADEARNIRMTNEGFQTRRNMLIISYGVTHLAGKPLVTATEEDTSKDIALARRKVLSMLSAPVITKLMNCQSSVQIAVNAFIEDPEGTLLKK